ncbi:MAG: hypothetical protein KF781_11420 [Chitinophagaceae bacterium]|nr:hypothetical protein [Chitinophagaceae bacterium]MCW5905800.1 hypothetical protein [Chitinophagaceae bacterium]
MKHLYNPFDTLLFQQNICFLTGKKLEQEQYVSAFPTWLMERYNLQEATIMMLNGNRVKYKNMLLPASDEVVKAIEQLDETTQKAFEQGYDAVKALPEITLFHWMARVLYGVLYQDFTYAIQEQIQRGVIFNVSDLLKRKLKNLLFMLQSLVTPIKFIHFSPYTIQCYRVKISKDILNYKDETHHFNFCLGMNGFAIAACLQDNGAVGKYLQEVLEKIGHVELHPAQFEELYGRFIYANYLLRDMPDYSINQEGETFEFSLPADVDNQQPIFRQWEDKTFAQVLANAWKPWGITLEEIYSYPNSPISYLIDEYTNEFITSDKVNLPF